MVCTTDCCLTACAMDTLWHQGLCHDTLCCVGVVLLLLLLHVPVVTAVVPG